jgi:hypothetical protein
MGNCFNSDDSAHGAFRTAPLAKAYKPQLQLEQPQQQFPLSSKKPQKKTYATSLFVFG